MVNIVINNGRVSSKVVAEKFGKRHDDVLKAYRNIKKQIIDAEGIDFIARNFAELNIIKENAIGLIENLPEVNMTRDGFSFLAMGFTGKEALAWKVRFIEAFNTMERALLNQPQAKPKLMERPKTARITQSVTRMEGIMGDTIYKRHMTRVTEGLLTPVERMDAKRLNLILQAEGCIRKAKKIEEEIDYLRQPPALRLIKD